MEWFSDMPKVAKPGGYTSLFDLNPLLRPLYTLQKTCGPTGGCAGRLTEVIDVIFDHHFGISLD